MLKNKILDVDLALNQIQLPHRVSVSQAALITGHKPEYLWQLCLTGQINATKIGRNWYLTKSTIQELLDSEQNIDPEDVTVGVDIPEQGGSEIEVPDILAYNSVSPAPVISENFVINKVDGLPISLNGKAVILQEQNLASLLTRAKLDILQKEVLQTVDFVQNLSDELEKQKEQLATLAKLVNNKRDLRDVYAPNLELAENSRVQVTTLDQEDGNVMLAPKLSYQVILWPLALMVIAVVGVFASLGNSAIPQANVHTIYYNSATDLVNAQVAGQSTQVVDLELEGQGATGDILK